MPSLTPSAVVWPSSLSKTARHIAHCASAERLDSNNMIKMNNKLYLHTMCFGSEIVYNKKFDEIYEQNRISKGFEGAQIISNQEIIKLFFS